MSRVTISHDLRLLGPFGKFPDYVTSEVQKALIGIADKDTTLHTTIMSYRVYGNDACVIHLSLEYWVGFQMYDVSEAIVIIEAGKVRLLSNSYDSVSSYGFSQSGKSVVTIRKAVYDSYRSYREVYMLDMYIR